MISNNIFKVEYGSLYNNITETIIDDIGFIYDRGTGTILKYGDLNKNFEQYYLDMQNKYIKAGLKDIADDILLIKLNRYESKLSIDEICIFCNYLIMCSANKSIVNNMLFNMTIEELKSKLKDLKERFGY